MIFTDVTFADCTTVTFPTNVEPSDVEPSDVEPSDVEPIFQIGDSSEVVNSDVPRIGSKETSELIE